MSDFAQLTIGSKALDHYSRLSYSMWYALAEFVDNSTQSRINYGGLIDDVLADEGTSLTVDIIQDKITKEIVIKDNSIGMSKDDLIAALRIAQPTPDSKGRSKYGMGMKTAACWIGRNWRIVTCEWDSGIEWTASVNVDEIATTGNPSVPLTSREVPKSEHYTKIYIGGLRRNIQNRTRETIKAYLGSMYMFDLKPEGPEKKPKLRLTLDGEDIPAPTDMEWDTDPTGKPMFRELPPTKICGKLVTGHIGILKKGGRKYGGFSLYQNNRQILGIPHAWKPKSIFGGVDDEGANNLVSQRLTGILDLDREFEVSHTKDAILFEGDEEATLEDFLKKETQDFVDYAKRRRSDKGQVFTKEKVKELVESLSSEFGSGEMKDALDSAQLPPVETILASNQQRVKTLTDSDQIGVVEVSSELKVIVSLQEVSEYEPYVTIAPGSAAGVIHVIINGLHPYYKSLGSSEAWSECIHQYFYDALAEYRTARLAAKLSPETIRKLKDGLLRAKVQITENQAAEVQAKATADLFADSSNATP